MNRKNKWMNPSGSRTYFAWRSMRSRCYNPKNPSYFHYGYRGIIVCEQWKNDFDQFYDDMGEVPEGMTLERINNNDGYHPGNCRWATIRDQLNNQRRNRRITFNGKTMTLSQWAEELHIGQDTLSKRLDRMDISKALTEGSLMPEWKHGTRHGYDGRGCRCQLCKEAHNARMRDLRKKRKSK